MYHEILDAMLASVVKLQSKGGVPFSFTYRGKRYDVNLKVYLMFIIGDTEGHDKLCGRYNSRALQVKQVCRHCDIPTMDCDNAFYPWRHVKPDAVHSLVVSNDLEGLKAMSQHPLKNSACGVDHVLYGRVTLDVSFQDVRVSTASMDSIIGVAFRVAVLVEKSIPPPSRSRAITICHPAFDDDVQKHCETKPREWFQVSETAPTVSLFGEHVGLWCYCQCRLWST
jgi:hypothetical protein